MTTPEELRVLGAVAPSVGEPPPSAAPTPGLALGAARVPHGPTVPDADPLALTLLATRLANEFFGGGVGAPATSLTTAPTTPSLLAATALPGTPSAPTSPSPAAPPPVLPAASALYAPASGSAAPSPFAMAAPSTAPSRPPGTPGVPATTSPFAMPLDLGAIAPFTDAGALAALSFPLLDERPSDATSQAPPAAASPPVEPAAPLAAMPAPQHSGMFDAPSLAEHAPPPIAPARIEPVSMSSVPGLEARSAGLFDPHAVRREFPILAEHVHGKPLVWLDNAATTQKPQAVIDRLAYFYAHENSNVHRAAHTLAARATDAYERARDTVRRFVNAPSPQEIVFVRGATEGINLVAQAWGRRHVAAGDEIVITWLEHHANIVPWQQLCAATGARLRVAPVDDRGQVDLEAYERLLGPRTRLVSITQVSNALGTITPAQQMVAMAHRHGARVLVDGAQAVSHQAVDVQTLDCDFYVFSGHKVFAPTGIGVVYGKRDVLEAMPPWQGGGNMIADVTFERTTYQGPPQRFEAGTGNIADAVGLGAALDWLMRLGLDNVSRYEHELLHYATACLATVPGLRIIGTAPDKAGVVSFVLAGQRTEEVGGLLDQEGIAVRSGHHCAQPILRRFGLEATVRASLAPYNTTQDIDALVAALRRLQVGRA